MRRWANVGNCGHSVDLPRHLGQADLESARAAEVEAKRRLADEAESAARQAAAQAETSAQLERVQVGASAAPSPPLL